MKKGTKLTALAVLTVMFMLLLIPGTMALAETEAPETWDCNIDTYFQHGSYTVRVACVKVGKLVEGSVVDATCTTPATAQYHHDSYSGWVSSIAGRYYETIPEHTFTREIAPALGHDWVEEEIILAPTCTAEGQAVRVCMRCNEREEVVLPAIPHDFDEGVVIKEPTYEEEGEKVFTCKYGCGAAYTERIPVLTVPRAEYSVDESEFVYDMDEQKLTGKVEHVEGTGELEKVYARVCFFYRDKTWASFVLEVRPDGTFKMGANTEAIYISVEIVDNEDATGIPDDEDVYGQGHGTIIEAEE